MATDLHAPVRLFALLLLTAAPGHAAETGPVQPAADEGYDLVVAHIPGSRAKIAPVALAELRIVLHRAKKQAALSLCQGNWLPEGELLQQLGPLPVALTGGEYVWIYQAAWRAAPLACEHTSRGQFFQEMSRHLPEWVTVSPAGQLSAYRQGQELPPPRTGLAVR